MGEMAQKIAKNDTTELLNILNMAFAEEWLAYYQYWLGAQLAVGPMRPSVADEFIEHANEELKHAQMLCNRIIQLGGTPVLNPDEWSHAASCKYDEPKDPYVMKLLEQNLTAERCAVARYQKICELTFGKDFTTYALSADILREELEHEEELNAYKDDIEATFNHQNEKL